MAWNSAMVMKICEYKCGSGITIPRKAAFIVHCSCIAVSCSDRISVSAPTTAFRCCKEVNLRYSALL